MIGHMAKDFLPADRVRMRLNENYMNHGFVGSTSEERFLQNRAGYSKI